MQNMDVTVQSYVGDFNVVGAKMMTLSLEMLAAGLGCSAANGAMHPLETTKVKLQLQCSKNLTYFPPTMSGVIRQVSREDGLIRGLFLPGLDASLLRSMMYGSYRVGLYPSVREWVFSLSSPSSSSNKRKEPLLVERIVSGMITGGVGAAISCPLDVLRTRMQADSGSLRMQTYVTGLRKGNPLRYRSTAHAFWTILKQEGLINGLYRGSSVTIARATLLNGSQLAAYDTLKNQIKKLQILEEGPLLHFTCALASGVIAQTVVMPADTIKSHFMLGAGSGWHGVMREVYQNGPRWLYRGYLPACGAQGFCMVLQMPLIERLRREMGLTAI